MHLVTRGHFRSRDSGHTVGSVIPENLCIRKLHGAIFYRTDRSLHCGNRNVFFYIFCSCDLDLDPMIFMYELDLYSLEMYRMCGNKLLTSRLSDRRTYRQKTRMKLYTTWLCGWSKYCFSEVSGGIFRSPDVCTSEDLNKRC